MLFRIETIFLNLTIFFYFKNIITTMSILFLKKPLSSALYPRCITRGYQKELLFPILI